MLQKIESSRKMWVHPSEKHFSKMMNHLVEKYNMKEIERNNVIADKEQFELLRGNENKKQTDLYLLVQGEVRGAHEAAIAELEKASEIDKDKYSIPLRVFASTIKEEYLFKNMPRLILEKSNSHNRYFVHTKIIDVNEDKTAVGKILIAGMDEEGIRTKEEVLHYLKNETRSLMYQYGLPFDKFEFVFYDKKKNQEENEIESKIIRQSLEELLD